MIVSSPRRHPPPGNRIEFRSSRKSAITAFLLSVVQRQEMLSGGWKSYDAEDASCPWDAETWTRESPLDMASSANLKPWISPRKRAFSSSSSAMREVAASVGFVPADSSESPSNQSEVVPNTRHSCLIVFEFGSLAPDSYFAHACWVKPSFAAACVCVKSPRSSFIRSETFFTFFLLPIDGHNQRLYTSRVSALQRRANDTKNNTARKGKRAWN